MDPYIAKIDEFERRMMNAHRKAQFYRTELLAAERTIETAPARIAEMERLEIEARKEMDAYVKEYWATKEANR